MGRERGEFSLSHIITTHIAPHTTYTPHTADIGTLQRLPRITGNDGLVRELAYTGRVFGAAEALQMGFLSGVSSASTRMSAFHMAMYTATAIAEKSPVAVMSTKKILAYSRDHRWVVACGVRAGKG